MKERIERLNTMVDEDRIIRNRWKGTDKDGRETACLLAALAPEVVEYEDTGTCPAWVMPRWFAHLTPHMDDHGSVEAWPRMVRRYAACASKWVAHDSAAWKRVEIAARRASVVESMATEQEVLDACHAVLAWLDAGMPEESREALQALTLSTAKSPTIVWADSAWIVHRATEGEEWWAMAVANRKMPSEVVDRFTDAVLTALEKECGLNQKEEA
jgi:hypothetical protein